MWPEHIVIKVWNERIIIHSCIIMMHIYVSVNTLWCRCQELVKVLTYNNGFTSHEAKVLTDYLIRNFDKNGDGKLDYTGEHFYMICYSFVVFQCSYINSCVNVFHRFLFALPRMFDVYWHYIYLQEPALFIFINSYSASHDNWCTATLWNRIMTEQCEGMGEVGSARYEPALLPPCPSIRALCYSNSQRSTQSHQQSKG